MKLLQKRKVIVTGVLAFLFTVMQVLGYQISMQYGTTVHQSDFLQNIGVLSPAQCIVLAVVEFAVWHIFLLLLFTVLEKIRVPETVDFKRKLFLLWPLAAVLLFICWIPCFRAVYPGFHNYDAMSQVPQALYEDVKYSAHHPLLHTLLMGKIIAFGYHHGVDINDGIALHSVFQMSVCAIAFAYMICYVLKITGKYVLAAAAFCYYAFFPPIAMFAMSTTKDIIFSILLQLCVIFVYEMCKDIPQFFASKPKVLRFFLLALLMCLFRKNGIYILVCILPFLVFAAKKYRRQMLLLLGSVMVVYVVISNSLILLLDAEKGSSEEMLSVPMQQLARVYCVHGEDAFEEEELELIYAGIESGYIHNYNPFLADFIKNYFDYNVIADNESDYLMLWLRKGLQYPKDYIKAFLDNTYQAWYPGTSIYDSPTDEYTYYFDLTMYPGAYRDSRDVERLEFYEKIAQEYYYQERPVVRLLFSIGAMFWVALFTLSFGIYRKNTPLVLAMLLVMFCCLTVFLGPISLVRYYLVLFYGFPVSLGFLLAGQGKTADARCMFKRLTNNSIDTIIH